MRNKQKRILRIEISIIITVVLVLIFIALVLFQNQIGKVTVNMNTENVSYDNYYVIITDESSSDIWESIYQGALMAGMEEADAYVEFVEVSNSKEYTLQDKMRIAIDSGVSGIIICTDGSEEITELINEASEKNIPVVTVLNDDSLSLRTCFVGVNNYSLGEAYGAVVWDCINQSELEDCTVSVLMDGDNADTGKNTTYLGIRDYIERAINENEWEYEIQIETVSMNRDETFEADETIGNIIVGGSTDIIICLNSEDTESAYQSIVDYNEVGNVEIIGYYESEIILDAIEKEIIQATISVNGEDVGYQCVMALYEYQESGYVNGYFPISIEVIEASNVAESLEKYQEVDDHEDD